jgi:hypothetical protein
VKRAGLSTDGDNPVLQPKTPEQDQAQRQDQQQGEQVEIRFIRDPDAAQPSRLLSWTDGYTLSALAVLSKGPSCRNPKNADTQKGSKIFCSKLIWGYFLA